MKSPKSLGMNTDGDVRIRDISGDIIRTANFTPPITRTQVGHTQLSHRTRCTILEWRTDRKRVHRRSQPLPRCIGGATPHDGTAPKQKPIVPLHRRGRGLCHASPAPPWPRLSPCRKSAPTVRSAARGAIAAIPGSRWACQTGAPSVQQPRGEIQLTCAAATRKRRHVRQVSSSSNGAHLMRRHDARSTMEQQVVVTNRRHRLRATPRQIRRALTSHAWHVRSTCTCAIRSCARLS